jgi:hypothetical protein
MEAATNFDERVDALDSRVRALVPRLADAIRLERREGAATWRHADAWGTLRLFETERPPRLSLLLYKHGGTDEQDAVEVSIDDADVVDVLAEPLAGLFAGAIA